MTRMHGLLALLGLSLLSADLRAQIVVVPNPYLGGNGGLLYARTGRHSSLMVSVGGYNVVPAYYGYGNPLYPPPYGYNGINQVTVLYPPPLALPPPQLLANAPRVLRLDDLPLLDPDLRADPPPKPLPDPQLGGGKDAGVFRPLAPDNRDRAAKPIPLEKVLPKPREPVGDLPRPAPAALDPRVESERQIKLGREAYAAREFGKATQRFRDAARGAPGESLPYFLLGQSLFSAGRYPEAVEAIRVGVVLRPDWPAVRFPPRDLYGPNPADFNDHLRRLREALLLLPDDPALLFLTGYELWIDGRQDEARPLFERAKQGVPDPAVIDRFLARPVL